MFQTLLKRIDGGVLCFESGRVSFEKLVVLLLPCRS